LSRVSPVLRIVPLSAAAQGALAGELGGVLGTAPGYVAALADWLALRR
jgi:hypothetical protein